MIDFMQWPEVAQCAYLAGLIDGDGTIGIKRRMPSSRNKKTTPTYTVSVAIEITDKEPVMCLTEFCGLPQSRIRSRKRAKHYKTIHILALEHQQAAALLRRIAPYLIAKRERAQTALEFQTLRDESRSHRTKVACVLPFPANSRAVGHTYRVMEQSDDYIARCDVFYATLLIGAPRSGKGACFRGISA